MVWSAFESAWTVLGSWAMVGQYGILICVLVFAVMRRYRTTCTVAAKPTRAVWVPLWKDNHNV